MIRTHENLSIIVREKTKESNEYKFLIRDGAYSYEAYHTQNGFEFFLDSRNIDLELVEERYSDDYGKVQFYKSNSVIKDILFWILEEVPSNAIQFTGLSNGSLVDCYYLHTENGSEIYRQNLNAKEVYNPMPINEHIAFQRVNG